MLVLVLWIRWNLDAVVDGSFERRLGARPVAGSGDERLARRKSRRHEPLARRAEP